MEGNKEEDLEAEAELQEKTKQRSGAEVEGERSLVMNLIMSSW
jgi:hypothetical protein